MKVLVIGGTGFLGRSLCAALVAAGASVTVGSRGNRQRDAEGRYRTVQLDVEIPRTLDAHIGGHDVVINLVGLSPVRRHAGVAPDGRFRSTRAAYRAVHYLGAINVARAAARAGVRRLIQMSALGVTPETGARYARYKARAAAALIAGRDHADHQIEVPPEVAVVEPSLLFGAEGEIIALFRSLARLPVAPVPRIGVPFDPIHVADAAEAITALAVMTDRPPSRVPLVGPERLAMSRMPEIFLRARGVRTVLLPSWIAAMLIPIVSRIPLPWFPPDLDQMLALSNIAEPSAHVPAARVRYSEWVAGYVHRRRNSATIWP